MQMVPVTPHNNAQLVMVYPPGGNPGMHHYSCGSCHHRHGRKKHRKKEESDSDSDSDSDDDTEYYVVSNPGQPSDSSYALVVDDGGKKGPVRVYPVNGAAGGRRQYEVFAPSHPQAVNQYVRSYNHGPGKAQPRRDNNTAAQAAAQSEADYYAALDRYNWAVAQPQPRDYWYGYGGYGDPYTDPYRPSDAMNEFDDYYCRPNFYDPTVFDCVNEGLFHNM